MKIETPQILWHSSSEGDNKCAPLYSVSFLPLSHPSNSSHEGYSVLATAGNSSEIHLWHLGLAASNCQPASTPSNTPISYVTALTRPHERSINSIAFSPHGIFLASAGDGGTLAIFVPTLSPTIQQTGSTNGPSSWHDVTEDKHVQFSLVRLQIEGHSVNDIMDLSWSRDDKRLVVGTLDHGVILIEHTPSQSPLGQWKIIWTNRENKNYVQGVAFDPLNVYLASQGSDRTVRVWTRKKPNRDRKSQPHSTITAAGQTSTITTCTHVAMDTLQSLAGPMDVTTTSASTTSLGEHTASPVCPKVPVAPDGIYFCTKFEVGKSKIIKYAGPDESDPSTATSSSGKDPSAIVSNSLSTNSGVANENARSSSTSIKKSYLFADESTVEFFFRRLAWTEDGAFLITPASLWHKGTKRPLERSDTSSSIQSATGMIPTCSMDATTSSSSPSFATYLFARHHYDTPYKVLAGLDKPSVAVCPNPVLFKLPSSPMEEYKENSPNSTQSTNPSLLPYRSIFAVLTLDSILIYDTFHGKPLSISRGYHCSGLTDCSWSSDGHNLVVSSNDGYISIIRFAKGELGEVYSEPLSIPASENQSSSFEAPPQDFHPLVGMNPRSSVPSGTTTGGLSSSTTTLLPPCEPGSSSTIVGPPCKKSRINNTTTNASSAEEADSFMMEFKKTSGIPKTEETMVIPTSSATITENNNEDGFVCAVTKLSLDYPSVPIVDVTSLPPTSSSNIFNSTSVEDGVLPTPMIVTNQRKHSLENSSTFENVEEDNDGSIAMMEEDVTYPATAPVSKKAKKRIQPTHMMDA